MMKRASVADVARLAGVSTATVSRVTTAPERVAEETRNKVLAAIEELDFVKSASGQNLRQQASFNILVVVRNIGNIYWSLLLDGIHSRAEAAGYGVMLSTPGNVGENGGFIDRLRTGRVDGVILLDPIQLSDEEMNRLDQQFNGSPPIVGFAEKPNGTQFSHVFINNEVAGYRATKYLIECGHTRIVHVHGLDHNVAAVERLAGFRRAMKEADLPVGPDSLWPSEFHRDGGRRAARRIARLPKMPTAIFCATDEIAMGCISEFDTLGIRVPQDVSVMGFDNNSFADVFVPPLCSMAQPREQIGVAAMDMLLEILEQNAQAELSGGETVRREIKVVELAVKMAKRASVRDISSPKN